MVEVIDYKKRTNEKGQQFYVLIVQGNLEPVKSKVTGKVYFSRNKASVPCTLDEAACETLIGTSFNGYIRKTPCDPYQFTIEETGETIEGKHRYEYYDEDLELIEENLVPEEEII